MFSCKRCHCNSDGCHGGGDIYNRLVYWAFVACGLLFAQTGIFTAARTSQSIYGIHNWCYVSSFTSSDHRPSRRTLYSLQTCHQYIWQTTYEIFAIVKSKYYRGKVFVNNHGSLPETTSIMDIIIWGMIIVFTCISIDKGCISVYTQTAKWSVFSPTWS